MKIRELCDIRMGYTFRKRPPHQPGGDVRIIQPRDVSSDGVLCSDDLDQVDTSGSKPLHPGDVLLINRGRFASAVFSIDNGDSYIASAAFLILSIKDNTVLPEYMALYFNSASGQRLLHRHLEKTTVPFISRSNLENMNIPVPPLAKQQTLIELEEINRRYARLSARKLELQKRIVNHELTKGGDSKRRRER